MILIGLYFMTTSALALADVALELGKLCDRADVSRLRGSGGTCRVVIAPRKVEKKVTCTGTFLVAMTCEVELNTGAEVATIGITCGSNLRRPTLAQEQLASVTAFQAVAVVTDANGKTSIVEDGGEYVVATSELAEMTLVERNSQLSAVVQLVLPNGRVSLTSLSCN